MGGPGNGLSGLKEEQGMRLAHMVPVLAGGAGTANNERMRFCTNCGTRFDPEPPDLKHPHRERVCPVCGLGVLLSTGQDMLARDGEAFLVVTSDLTVSAASDAATELFGLESAGMVGRPLLSLLDSPLRGSELARRVARAAAGVGDVSLLRVQVGGRVHEVRVGRCGDPRAALVVFSTRS
jgi:PAS domain-containing protein